MTQVNIDNTPISAIAADAIKYEQLSLREVGLQQHKIQLALLADARDLVVQQLQAACGLALPEFGEKSQNDKLTILATTPDKWLLLADKRPDWLHSLADNEQVFINEQSSAYSIIEITGADTLALMQQLSFIDWANASPVVLTQLAGDYNSIVERIGQTTNQGYRLYVTRSLAQSFWHMLLRLCKGF